MVTAQEKFVKAKTSTSTRTPLHSTASSSFFFSSPLRPFFFLFLPSSLVTLFSQVSATLRPRWHPPVPHLAHSFSLVEKSVLDYSGSRAAAVMCLEDNWLYRNAPKTGARARLAFLSSRSELPAANKSRAPGKKKRAARACVRGSARAF